MQPQPWTQPGIPACRRKQMNRSIQKKARLRKITTDLRRQRILDLVEDILSVAGLSACILAILLLLGVLQGCDEGLVETVVIDWPALATTSTLANVVSDTPWDDDSGYYRDQANFCGSRLADCIEDLRGCSHE